MHQYRHLPGHLQKRKTLPEKSVELTTKNRNLPILKGVPMPELPQVNAYLI